MIVSPEAKTNPDGDFRRMLAFGGRQLARSALMAPALVPGVVAMDVAEEHINATVVVGGMAAELRPTGEGSIVVDGGIAAARIPTSAALPSLPSAVASRLGAEVRVTGLHDHFDSDSLGDVAGDLETIRNEAIRLQMLRLGMGLAATGLSLEVLRRAKKNDKLPGVVTGIAALGIAAHAVPGLLQRDLVEPSRWQEALSFVPAKIQPQVLEVVPIADQIEVRGGNGRMRDWINSAIEDFALKPWEFFEQAGIELEERWQQQNREKLPGEFRVLVISDLHSNFFVSRYLWYLARATKPDVIVLAGDQTGTDGVLEGVLLKEIMKQMNAEVPIVFVSGNHDGPNGDGVLEDMGATRLDGGIIALENGIRIVGFPDNTRDRIGAPTELIGPETSEYAKSIADTVCELSEQNPVDMVLTHRPQVLEEAISQGCAPFFVYGHMHKSFPPETHVNADDISVVSQGVGTTSGAKTVITLSLPQTDSNAVVVRYAREVDRWRLKGTDDIRLGKTGGVRIKTHDLRGETKTRDDIARAQAIAEIRQTRSEYAGLTR